MTDLRLTSSATIASSDGRPLTLHRVQLLAGDGPARADCEDAHGQPILEVRAGPAEPSSATSRWRADHPSGRTISGFGVHLTTGAVLLIDAAPQADAARDPAHLIIVDGPPKQRSYRTPSELNDSSTAAMRRSKP
jgi:hypothetical protein